jgi:[ribosomal protein S5]-alanine N-acetyltransferase
MNKSPTIRTRRLELVPFSARHLTSRYVSWLNDPEVVHFSEQRHRRHTLETSRVHLEALEETPDLLLAIETLDTPFGHVGNIGVSIDRPNGVADIAIIIGEKAVWGQGLGTEAVGAVCRHLFEEVGMRKIGAGTMAVNHGMRSIMRKVGMTEECRRLRHFVLEGKEVDAVYGAAYRDK